MLNFRRISLFFIITLFFICGVFSVKGFFSQKNNNFKLNLGLELVGGSSLTLEADIESYTKELNESSLFELKKFINSNNIFLNESFILHENNNKKSENHSNSSIIFRFNKKNFELLKEKNIIEKFQKNYKIIENDKKYEIRVFFDENYLNFLKDSAINEAIKNINRRIDSLGNKEISIEKLGSNKILLQAPGFDDPQKLKYLVGKTGKLGFHLVDDDEKSNDVLYLKTQDRYKNNKLLEVRLERKPIIDGKFLKTAYANISQKGVVTVHFSLNKEGAEIFSNATGQNIGKKMAIVIDNEILSIPLIKEKIPGGSVEISGSFDYTEASSLAASLRSGALPIRLFISEEKLVGASAGADLVKKGAKALFVALLLVGLFMVIVYGSLGLVAIFGILLNLFLILSIMILSESTLSLAGVAGLVLTVGIIVDNNVLIFERIREEIDLDNKAYIKIIRNGFDKAIITITDSNITTIISASLLFFFGDNNLKSFALTLIYGVAISFFSTIWVSKIIIQNFDSKIIKTSFFLKFKNKNYCLEKKS
jgi:preprotein translocase subunit SecD